VLVAVQSQDRVSQMLQHTCADQSRLLSCLSAPSHTNDADTQLAPQAWLSQLKTTYTTAEELAVHEGRPVPEPVLASTSHVVEQDTTFF
jgi:methyl-accepting chemotaxis protein